MNPEKREEEPIRHRIAYAYLELLKKKDRDEISITEIAKAAGVSRMAFYRKFETKWDVVDFYLGGIMHWEVAYDERTGGDLNIWDVEYGVRFFRAMREHRENILTLVDRGYATLLLRVINLTNENAGGDMPSSSIERYNLYFLAGAGFNAMLIWLRDGCKESPEEMAQALAKYMGSP
ncbi:MAG: TetR/AcrR family transcriptional regulator [Oscillospiraceae bacterium]|nr:TetR/AcrR family transcriptional regulator [Oscillospiraceae bacterium]